MKKISLCYIAKNEEENIKSSILSCKEIADEIIVVDTGSTDNTVTVAQELGAKIEYFEWCNDFAKARNYAISKCSGDYILFLDADEYFAPALTIDDKAKINECLVDDCDVYAFLQEDIDKLTKKIHHTVYLVRLFKNCEYLRYSNSIHEALSNVNGEEMVVNIIPNFKLIHTGYSSDISVSKAERNLNLLEELQDKRPIDYYYLARESLSLNKPEDTIKYADIFFEQPNVENVIASTTMVYDIYFCVLRARKMLPNVYTHKDILSWLNQMKKILPEIPKVYYHLGLYYFDFDFRKSKEYFLEALLKEKELIESRSTKLDDFESYKADIYYYLAKIEFFEGKRQNAINRAGVACAYDKTNQKYFGLLLALFSHQRTQNIVNKNINFIINLFKPQKKEDFIFIIRGLANTDLIEEFIHFSVIAVRNFTITAEDGCSDIYFAELMSTNNPDEVLIKINNGNNAKTNLIKLCCLIYKQATQNTLGDWTETFANLPKEHQEVYNLLINLEKPEECTDTFKVLLKDTFLKMVFLGFAGITIDFLEILKTIYGYDKNMSTIINVWTSTGDVDNYKKAIAFVLSIKPEEIIDTDAYAKDCLYLLFVLGDYDALIEKAWQCVEQGYSLPMNYIKAASPSKKFLKQQRELCNAEMI